MKLLLGDCLDKLKELDDNSVDSIVTDPPYGLSFMGKKWDYDVPSVEIWEECLRVLKPGGHLLAFAGSRTYHRMAVRIEDAGFEIRDQIMWIYGSGFPKSLNVGKILEKYKATGNASWNGTGDSSNGALGYSKLQKEHGYRPTDYSNRHQTKIEIDNEWEGWGTGLKPAHEPIVMARKPFSGPVVKNVLDWGTGGLNIDGCRIETDDNLGGGATNGSVLSVEGFDRPWMHDEEKMKEFSDKMKEKVEHAQTLGRFPANVIFDEEAGKILDEQSGTSKSTGGRSGNKNGIGSAGIYGKYDGQVSDEDPGFGDVGGASRFFYCPKTSKSDRNEGLEKFETKKSSSMPGRRNAEDMTSSKIDNDVTGRFVTLRQNIHPTVKPTDLMAYLIRLVTKKGGVVLDPFMGSGSTGKAAVREGMDFIGIEREDEYFQIAEARIQYQIDNKDVVSNSKTKGIKTKIKEEVKNKFW